MSEKMAKIDVKNVSVFVDHDVVRVSVPDPQDESSDAVASAGVSKRFYGLFITGQ